MANWGVKGVILSQHNVMIFWCIWEEWYLVDHGISNYTVSWTITWTTMHCWRCLLWSMTALHYDHSSIVKYRHSMSLCSYYGLFMGRIGSDHCCICLGKWAKEEDGCVLAFSCVEWQLVRGNIINCKWSIGARELHFGISEWIESSLCICSHC